MRRRPENRTPLDALGDFPWWDIFVACVLLALLTFAFCMIDPWR